MAEAVLAFEDVELFRGRRRVLAGVRFAIRAGEAWALIGRNGAGKSTLLLAALGTLKPRRGAVRRAPVRIGVRAFPGSGPVAEPRTAVAHFARDELRGGERRVGPLHVALVRRDHGHAATFEMEPEDGCSVGSRREIDEEGFIEPTPT